MFLWSGSESSCCVKSTAPEHVQNENTLRPACAVTSRCSFGKSQLCQRLWGQDSRDLQLGTCLPGLWDCWCIPVSLERQKCCFLETNFKEETWSCWVSVAKISLRYRIVNCKPQNFSFFWEGRGQVCILGVEGAEEEWNHTQARTGSLSSSLECYSSSSRNFERTELQLEN